MVTAREIEQVAMSLPRTEKYLLRDWTKFRVGRIVYATISPDETILGFAFPKEQRIALVTGEPYKFELPKAADLRYNWVQARTAALDADEMWELVVDAWQMVVSARAAEEHLASPAFQAARSKSAASRRRPADPTPG